MEARRSSRASRASQPLAATAPSNHSSASSNSSGRADRATRSHQKTESPRKSPPNASEEEEDKETTKAQKRARSNEKDKDKSTKAQSVPVAQAMNYPEETADDDEAVRCICGFEEYPGPVLIDEDSKEGIKEETEEPLISPADMTEDLAGFFVQCDVCKVWQHGGCVGIQSEEQSPDEYFCEECRKDLHKIFTAPNGQQYSHYVPLFQSLSRTTSRAASFSKDGTRSPRGSKSGRPSSSAQSAKRRSTMNSRDAAYDEEEQLRRAIEASKGGASGESTDGGTRQGKRGRSESEDKEDRPKRQRTTSASPSPLREQRQVASQVDSDDAAITRPIGAKKIRGAAARNHREKELREEREKARIEAKKKREGRAERRRLEDSETRDDLPPELVPHNKSPDRSRRDPSAPPPEPPSSQVAAPDSPPSNPPTISQKKGGRPPNARKGKLGKNQYTKDKDIQDRNDKSPGRSQSRDVMRSDEEHIPSTKPPTAEKLVKPKNNLSRVTMTDMKRRVAFMLEFISRIQLEMAGALPGTNEEETGSIIRNFTAQLLPMIQLNESRGLQRNEEVKEFNDMTSLEMMDVLATQLVKWQKEFT